MVRYHLKPNEAGGVGEREARHRVRWGFHVEINGGSWSNGQSTYVPEILVS